MPDEDSHAVTDLRSYVRYYDGALESAFCMQIIDAFEKSTHLQMPNGRDRHIRFKQSAWIELNLTPLADKAFLGFFHTQIDKYLAKYNRELQLTIPVPTRPTIDDLRIKHYRTRCDDAFETHFDSIDEKSRRFLVFLWYLNDVADGGETQFEDIGVKISARAGRLLIFPPYWMFQHAGLKCLSNDKYIISTYLMF